MDKISEITEAQKAKMPEYVQKWTEIGRSTAPMDFEKTVELIMLTMNKVNAENTWDDAPAIPPERIFRCSSPILAQQAGRQIATEMGYPEEEVDGYWPAQVYGSSAARFDFILNEMGVIARLDASQKKAWEILEVFAQVCGGVYFGPNFAIVADRPAVLKLMQLGNTHVLHCPDGPAIAWGRDADGNYDPNDPYGSALYYWQGTEVPCQWVVDRPTDKEGLRALAQEILQDPNAERRTAGCELIGWANILEALEPRVLDKHENPMFGELVEVDFPRREGGGTEPVKFLVAMCGTGRRIAFPAMPEATTALEAGAMSYRLTVEEYSRLKYRS